MDLSVIIITRNEAPRLRFCLASVQAACARAKSEIAAELEVIVVDDASTDETARLCASLSSAITIRHERNARCEGRSASRNRGAREARGRTILFLDGDTVISPSSIVSHLQFHGGTEGIARGEVFNLRQARFLRDPETGEAFEAFSTHNARSDELLKLQWVTDAFHEIERRAEPGIYPGAVSRRLAELECHALRAPDRTHSLWMTASAHNISIPKEVFHDVGGFTESLTMNEHRELALKADIKRGYLVHLLDNSQSYHLCHSHSWRDPLEHLSLWEPLFRESYPRNDVRLLPFFWLSVAESKGLPSELFIPTLSDLLERAQGNITPYEEYRAVSPLFSSHSHA